jgi:hypothetical protein
VALVRVNASGGLDPLFGGGDGVVIDDLATEDVVEEIMGLALHQGNIVVAGTELNNGDVLLAGYESDGDRNTTSFGIPGLGYVLTDNGGDESGFDVAVAGDKLIVVGTTNLPGDDFLVVRYLASGLPDASGFGTGGIVTTDFAAGPDRAHAAAIDADGKIVAVGSTLSGATKDFAVARYLSQGSGGPPVINGFEGDSFTLNGTFSPSTLTATQSIVIVWGDGTPDQTLGAAHIGSGTFSVPHTWADNSNLVTAKIVDSSASPPTIASDSAVATIANVAPVAGAITGGATTVRGQSVTFGGSFTDVGILDTHHVAWDFGDGVQIPFQSSTVPGALAPTHAYANAGTYVVTFTVKDDDLGQDAVTKSVTIVIAQLEPAPCGCGTALVVGGTGAAENILISPAAGGAVQLTIDAVSIGTFSPSHALVVHAYSGNDDVVVGSGIGLAAWLYGGQGNDRLKGGSGSDMLQGQQGDDLLVGSAGRDLLIGGLGADRIVGDSHDDILVAGTTSHDANATALCHILAEWNSDRLYWIRALNLVGVGCFADRSNGNYFLNDDTVQDDGARDLLTGSTGIDLFYANLSLCNDDSPTKDKITDQNWWEFALDIDFISGA